MEAVMEKIGIGKYSSYKDSGVEWVGIIPQHWNIKPIRAVFQERNEKNTGPKTDFILSVTRDRGVIPYDEKGNIGNNKSEDIERYKVVYPNDLVINKMNVIIGSLGLSKYHGALSQVYIVLQPRTDEFSINYYSYLFSNESFYKSLIRYCTGIMELRESLNKEEFKKLPLPLPPIEEQTAIADFLDRKTAQIDKAIAQKEKLIELLKERRQILIHKAVTRGLDPNVQMKDSGVEWIGEIPEHWEVEKIKYHFRLIGGGTPSKERTDYWNGEIPWVSPKDMKSDYISQTEDRISEKALKHSTTNLIPPETLLMVVRSGILQRNIPVAISQVELSLNQDMKAFIPFGNVETEFLFFFIKGCDSFLRNEWVKQVATVESIEIPIMENYWCLIPPIQEQINIVLFIRSVSKKFDTAISFKQKEIEKLKEYKATLINAAVTGKIKVG